MATLTAPIGVTAQPGGGVRLRMSVAGATDVDVAISRFGAGISDWTPFFREYAAPLIFDRIQSNMRGEGSWVGGWPPLSPAYARWKIRQVGRKRILQFTGRLVQSLTWEGGSVGPGGIARFTKTLGEFGTTVTSALFHQRGSRRLPKRQIIALPASDTLGRLLHRFVVDQRRLTQRATSRTTPA